MSAFGYRPDGSPLLDWKTAEKPDVDAASAYLLRNKTYATWDDWDAAVQKARTRDEFEHLQDAGRRLPWMERRVYWFSWIQSYASLHGIKLYPRRRGRQGDFQRR